MVMQLSVWFSAEQYLGTALPWSTTFSLIFGGLATREAGVLFRTTSTYSFPPSPTKSHQLLLQNRQRSSNNSHPSISISFCNRIAIVLIINCLAFAASTFS